MRKILITIFLTLFINNNLSAEIIFRVICEKPKGKIVGVSKSTADNIERPKLFLDDSYPDNDLIELIYDNNRPKKIQRIWGSQNELIELDAYNEHFYHWRNFQATTANGFSWNDWSFSLPELMMVWTVGATYKDLLGSGINSTTMYSKCKRVN